MSHDFNQYRRFQSINSARDLLTELSTNVEIPVNYREWAISILIDYPNLSVMMATSKLCPELYSEKPDD